MKKQTDKQSSKIYMKLLLYFTVSISAAIFIVSMLLYFNFENITVQKDYSYIKGNLSQISYSASFMETTVNNLLLQLSSDDDLKGLFMDYPPEAEELATISRRLNTYVYAIPFIHSIYMYNRSTDSFYSPGYNSYTRNEFFDKEAIYILDNFNKYNPLSPIPRVLTNNSTNNSKDSKINIYSFVYFDPQFNKNNNTLDKAIIFNIDANWLKDIIDSLDGGQENVIYIIDKSGNVVMGDSSVPMLTKLDKSDYLQNILNNKNPSGYFIHNINNVKSLVTFVSLEALDWKFICITPYSSIIGKVSEMRNQTILICFILLVFSLFLAYMLTRKVYSPINNILVNFKSLQSENKKGLLLQKQNYLKKALISGFVGKPENLRRDFNVLDVKISSSGDYVVLLIQIDNYMDFCDKYSTADRDLFKFAITNIASELLETHKLKNEPIDFGQEHVALIINYQQLDMQSDNMKNIASSIINSVMQYLEISISVSISSSTSDITKLNTQYQEAIEASHYRLFKGKGSMISHSEISQRIGLTFTYPVQKETQLIDSLMLGNIGNAKDTFDEILSFAKDYSYASFNLTTTWLATAINIAMYNLEKNNAFKLDYDFSLFQGRLEEIEFYEDIRAHFFNIFEYISSKLLERKNVKYDEIVSKIIDIINKHYSEPSLSLDSISEVVGLSPSYISKIFKQSASKTVIEYITQTRLEVAKNLLSTTDYPMNVISEKIGLNYSNYFYKLFKKAYGITPHEYKQSLTLNKDI